MKCFLYLTLLCKRNAFACILGILLIISSGCNNSSSGGTSPGTDTGGVKPNPVSGATAKGSVFGGQPVVGATVAFVEAFSVESSQSVQPIEDLAGDSDLKAETDRDGQFSITVPEGSYFIHVIPAADDTIHLPGGNFARESFYFADGTVNVLNITLSEKPPHDAQYVGSSKCLECHKGHATAKQTLHFLGFRKLSAAGTELSSLQDLSKFPDADKGLLYYDDGNPNDNTGSINDGYGYRIATTNGYNILLGHDPDGYFQTFETLDGQLIAEHLYILFSYGGEGRYKHRFVTRLDKDGYYTDDPLDGSYYILPGQYSETAGDPTRGKEITVPTWVTYHADRWAAPSVDNGKAATTPALTKSFDNDCAGCHFTGLSLTRNDENGLFHAHAVSDPGGPLDFDGDGHLDEMNIGCERCHGAGSAHVVQGKGYILQPEYLPPGRANLICGQCHTRGHGNGTIDDEGHGGYPSRNNPVTGEIEFVQAGISPAEFYGTSNGYGILPDFGTNGGFYNPINFATTAASSWLDMTGKFGTSFDHSKQHRQQYLDIMRSKHFQNPWDILACWDCHTPHERELRSQITMPFENNLLCLRCHAGHGDFKDVSQEMLDDIENGTRQSIVISQALNDHQTDNTFDLVGDAMNLGASAYSNPGGTSALGRCVICHMPKTAKSASWITDDEGFVIRGDISSHTFDVISPDTSLGMSIGGKTPVPNSCSECHRGIFRGAYPDYRH